MGEEQQVHLRTEKIEWDDLLGRLQALLRIRTTPIGMKLFESVEEMESVPRIRRPDTIHTTDQIVGMASRLNWTVGITRDDLVGDQCGAVIGLHPQDEDWLSGERMQGVWFESLSDSNAHQEAMDCVPFGTFRAMAVSPLSAKRLDPPDICLIYATPAQMILFINGLQWRGYKNSIGDVSASQRVLTVGVGHYQLESPAFQFLASLNAGTEGSWRMSFSWH